METRKHNGQPPKTIFDLLSGLQHCIRAMKPFNIMDNKEGLFYPLYNVMDTHFRSLHRVLVALTGSSNACVSSYVCIWSTSPRPTLKITIGHSSFCVAISTLLQGVYLVNGTCHPIPQLSLCYFNGSLFIYLLITVYDRTMKRIIPRRLFSLIKHDASPTKMRISFRTSIMSFTGISSSISPENLFWPGLSVNQ